ncbi:MAG TPA: SCP2 sterol-binding domain-containing protein [Anaerolineales bacterium]|nr:SCP2 sterol-binding domain-containing protein [Anaerolineales bacterium]
MDKAIFPTSEWMQATKEKLNTDQKYAQIAKNWEGDLRLILEPDGPVQEAIWLYWDLWHGKCREAFVEEQSSNRSPALIIKAPYQKFVRVLSAEIGVMQALMGRMVKVQGDMILIMRNVPTVLDFVRCCQEATTSWL